MAPQLPHPSYRINILLERTYYYSKVKQNILASVIFPNFYSNPEILFHPSGLNSRQFLLDVVVR